MLKEQDYTFADLRRGELVAARLIALRDKTKQLRTRHDELTLALDDHPTAPSPTTLTEITNHITNIINTGSANQRKALIEALVAHVTITAPNRLIPVFRIPQPPTPSEAATAPPAETTPQGAVRTMTKSVDLLIAYSKRLDLLSALVSAVERLQVKDARTADTGRSVRSEQAPRVWRVSDRLSEADLCSLVSGYLVGLTARELAERFKISKSSVKRLLRERGIRRTSPLGNGLTRAPGSQPLGTHSHECWDY